MDPQGRCKPQNIAVLGQGQERTGFTVSTLSLTLYVPVHLRCHPFSQASIISDNLLFICNLVVLYICLQCYLFYVCLPY